MDTKFNDKDKSATNKDNERDLQWSDFPRAPRAPRAQEPPKKAKRNNYWKKGRNTQGKKSNNANSQQPKTPASLNVNVNDTNRSNGKEAVGQTTSTKGSTTDERNGSQHYEISSAHLRQLQQPIEPGPPPNLKFLQPYVDAPAPTPSSLLNTLPATINRHETWADTLREAEGWFRGTATQLYQRTQLCEQIRDGLGEVNKLLREMEELKKGQRRMGTARQRLAELDVLVGDWIKRIRVLRGKWNAQGGTFDI